MIQSGWRNLLLIVASLSSLSCTNGQLEVGSDEQDIIGGNPATTGEFPTVVALAIGSGNMVGLCSGTLVAPNVVVTAAHCLNPAVVMLPNQATVTADTTVFYDTTNVFTNQSHSVKAKTTIPNPSFDPNNLGQGRYDIGIVILATPILSRPPSPILRDVTGFAVGAAATLVGFGESNPANQNSAGVLNVLDDKVSTDCETFGGHLTLGPNFSDANLICFNQSDSTGACEGDSGGPAFTMVNGKLAVAGMTSVGDMTCKQFGVYTRLAAEITFFDQQMMAANACAADGVCTPACGAGLLPADPDCASQPGQPDAGAVQPGQPDAHPSSNPPDAGVVQPGQPDADNGGGENGGGGSGGCAVGSNGGNAAGTLFIALALGLVALRRRRA